MTVHSIFEADSRDLSFVGDQSVHLVITHPPRLGTAPGEGAAGQLSQIRSLRSFMAALDAVWAECMRVLVPGGLICCVADSGTAGAVPGRGPLAGDIHIQLRVAGFEPVGSIRWVKATGLALDEERFLGQPNLPHGVLLPAADDIVLMRKPGASPEVGIDAEVESRLSARQYATWFSPVWTVPAPVVDGYPDELPLEIASRLVRMFSFAGQTVLDPFAGSGTIALAAQAARRRSIGVEVEPAYVELAQRRFEQDAPGGEKLRVKRRKAAPRPAKRRRLHTAGPKSAQRV